MAEPSVIAREARSLHACLKELLKTRNPWDKEVEFQRQDLRRRYLSLLLLHPYAPESKDADNHLWMQTSYSFITVYKQSIANIDRAIQHDARPPPNSQRGHGVVEHRKLTQRFRQFLADEDKFWAQFAARFRRAFAIREANHAFLDLHLATQDELEGRDDAPPQGRQHFHFPDPTPYTDPMTDEQRRSRLSIISKALICMGDIARYREQYNESGGRPRAGHEEHELLAPLKRERGGRRGRNKEPNLERRPRNYDRAQSCYEHARRLVPDDGNPSHQMAIIASYQTDVFSSVVHYYRALCVRQPYETAADNLSTVFHKALEQYKRHEQKEHEGGEVSVRARIEGFKEKIIVIHALWRHSTEKSLDSLLRQLTSSACTDFHSLISQRHLPHTLIEEVMILAQAALWKHRMIRERKPGAEKTESRIFNHLLLMHRTLLEVGIDELRDAGKVDKSAGDLAQRITGEFRRTLPALRLASKWLHAHYAYVMRGWDPQAVRAGRGAREREQAREAKKGSAMLVKFWQKYADFGRALARAFPPMKLPALSVPLEEDVDMRGFLPLKGQLDEQAVGAFEDQAAQEHPNVLQLMRISDLLEDARALAKREDAPITLYGNQFVLKGVEAQVAEDSKSGKQLADHGASSSKAAQASIQEVEEDLPEGVNVDNDADDVLKQIHVSEAAMQVDDEEQIVWDPRAPASPDGRIRSRSISNMPFVSDDPIVPQMPSKATVAPIGSPITPLKPISPSKDAAQGDNAFSLFPSPQSDPSAKNTLSSLTVSPLRGTEIPLPSAQAAPSQAKASPARAAAQSMRDMLQSPAVGTTAQDLVKNMMAPRRPDGRQSAIMPFTAPSRAAGAFGAPLNPLVASVSPLGSSSGYAVPSALGVLPPNSPFGAPPWSAAPREEPLSIYSTSMLGPYDAPNNTGMGMNAPPMLFDQPPALPPQLSLSQQTAWSSQSSQGFGPLPPQLMPPSLPPSQQTYVPPELGRGAGMGYGGGPLGLGGEPYGREPLGYSGELPPAHAGSLALDPHPHSHLGMDPRYGPSAMWGNAMG